jgi:hypothetical protein
MGRWTEWIFDPPCPLASLFEVVLSFLAQAFVLRRDHLSICDNPRQARVFNYPALLEPRAGELPLIIG